jgi:hypothetical protein
LSIGCRMELITRKASIGLAYDPNEDPPFTLWPPDPDYTPRPDHCYVWDLDQIDPNTNGCMELRVVVNDDAVSGEYLHNVAELYGLVWVAHDPNDPNTFTPETRLVARAWVDTLVCCAPEPITTLYVDKSAVSGNETGLNWENAFIDLQDALVRALDTTCGQVDTILVAQGTYVPGNSEDDTFALSANLSLYGGFPSGGCDFIDRNPKKYKTILSGLIDPNTLTRADTVVTMADETLLDGFTITGAGFAFSTGSIYGSGVDFEIANCKIEKNDGYGAYIEDGNATFTWCRFTDNKRDGIYHSGENKSLILANVWVRQSGRYGVRCYNSTPILRNSNITESDMAREGRAGIYMVNPTSQPTLQNLTVAHNKAVGIARIGGTLPLVQNSIVYHNGGPALAGFSAEQAAQYSCIQDCNEVNNNINDDPMFVYFDPNNVRIKNDSPCHDSGLTLQENYNQTDMDGRERILGMAVDRGAYEIECEDTSNSFDTNHDGLVNLHEFADFSRVWMAHDPNDVAFDPNSPSYNPDLTDPNSPDYVTPSSLAAWYPDGYKYNYVTTGDSEYVIDLADLTYWLEEAPWLWKACWLTDDYLFEMMGGGEMLMMGGEFPAEAGIQAELSVAEQIARLTNSIIFLERIWLEYPDFQNEIDAEAWSEFVDALYQELVDLYMGTQ